MNAAQMIAALADVMGEDNDREGFYTTAEIADMLGCAEQTARKKIKAAMKAGRVEMKEFREPNMRGYVSPHTGYRITAA